MTQAYACTCACRARETQISPRIAALRAGSTHSLKQLLLQHFFVVPSQSQSNIHSSESEAHGPDGGFSCAGHVPGRGTAVRKQHHSALVNRQTNACGADL